MLDLFAVQDLDTRTRIDWTPPSLPNLTGIDWIILDTETTGLDWWGGALPIGLAIGTLDGQYWYFPFAHKGGGNLSEAGVRAWAIEHLRGKNIIGHNIKFDNHMMRAWGVDLEALGCRLWDTGYNAALLDDNRRQFNLDLLAKDILGVEGKEHLTDYTHTEIDKTRMQTYHAGEIAIYAKMDVQLTGDLWTAFKAQTKYEGLGKVMDLESRLLYAVCEMERNPARLDVEKLTSWEKRSGKELDDLLTEIHSLTGMKLNPDSSVGWAKLFKHLELPEPTVLTPKTKKGGGGNPSYAEDVLKTIDHPVVQIGRKAKQLSSLRSKYINAYLEGMDSDGRLRTNLHQLRVDEGGTISGRFSSSSYKINGKQVGRNLQQVYAVEKQIERFGNDYIIRDLFLPDEGRWFSADAAQIEYRLFAHYSGSETILARYAEDVNTDYHQIILDMLAPFKSGIPRKHIKNINFAKLYGAGIKKIGVMIGLPFDEAKPFVELYEREIPESVTLMDLAMDTARRRGYVKTLLGRRARFPKAQRLHKALNSIIQGTAADIMKEKTIETYEARKELGLTLRLTVHDELDGDILDVEMARRLKVILNRQSFDIKVPILWTMQTGTSWADCEKTELRNLGKHGVAKKVKVNEL